LVEKKLQEKTINNILGVLSKPLRYAVVNQQIRHGVLGRRKRRRFR